MSNEFTSPEERWIAEVWGQQAERYASFTESSFSWDYIEMPAFDKHLGTLYKTSPITLDVGCGNGRIIEHLIGRGINQDNITGLDLNRDLLKIARERLPQVSFIQASLANANLKSDTFDLITSSMVFHLLGEDSIRRAFANFYRWLKEDGTLFFVVPHPVRFSLSNPYAYQARGWRAGVTPWGTGLPFFHRTTADFLNATIQAGFNIEAVDEPDVLEKGDKPVSTNTKV